MILSWHLGVNCLEYFTRGECLGGFAGKFGGGRIFNGELSRVSIRILIQDYKSLCAAVVIWATLVNTQTDRRLLTSYTTSSAR